MKVVALDMKINIIENIDSFITTNKLNNHN